MPKPKLPRKPRPLRLPGIGFKVAEVVEWPPVLRPHVWLSHAFLPCRLDLGEVSRLSRWLANAHAYIAAVEARKEADRG